MPLQYVPPVDPNPQTRTQRAVAGSSVIESDALQRLMKEIERYGRREISGRSILIAGHRGVGKTTLVRKAIESVRSLESSYGGRPLFVDLHGPDLLAPPEKSPENPGDAKPDKTAKGHSAKDDAEAGVSGSDSFNQPSGVDLQRFVERLTFSLYRAAAKEFAESFHSFGQSVDMDRSELAEQFALELDSSTDLRRIRLLYERAGAFEQGVLQTHRSSGSRELALLAASSQAYRIISGKLEEGQKRENSGKNAVNWSIAANNILSPVTGLLTGSLAWAALPSNFGPLAKLFTSFTAGLASAIAIKFSRTIERETMESNEFSFIPARDRVALRRLLPVLVDRFCDVGLPPIFVVDELDKVSNISDRMEALMGFLKQFVTERAFFCFLVNRDYYEKLEATVSTGAFPKEATLFGDRLFVQYKPESFHGYLKKITRVGDLAAGESKDDAARDLQVLPYVLLRRSYMHPFDLRREISRCTNDKYEFRFPPRALYNVKQYRNEVYYQVAVECVLSDEKLLDFAEDPNRAQLLYDSLYFPIRTKQLHVKFNASLGSLREHLAERMGKGNGKLLSEDDLNIVHNALQQLILFLREPQVLLEAIKAPAFASLPNPKVFPPAAMGIIEAAAGSTSQGPDTQTKAAPLLVQCAEANRYRWQYDKFGFPNIEGELAMQFRFGIPGAGEVKAPAAAPSLLGDYEDATKLLKAKQGTIIDIELWERMRLIPTPPTWSYLREAADALRNPASLPAEKQEEYNKAFTEYRSKLHASLEPIGRAIAIAATMAIYDKKPIKASTERDALEFLAGVLADASSRDQVLKQLEGIARGVAIDIPLQAETNASYQSMINAIEAAAKTAREQPAMDSEKVAQESEAFYKDWFMQLYDYRQPVIDSIRPFLSQAINFFPFGLRRINPLQMTIKEWTQMNRQPQPDPIQKVVSLERLGFRREAERLARQSEDPLFRAIAQFIQKRGYERVTVTLQPLEKSLTDSWLPSENIACHISGTETDFRLESKYLLLEIDESWNPEKIKKEFADLDKTRRLVLFGPSTEPPGLFPYPYVPGPQNLDDLVARLEAQSSSA
jgi:hypothetical protein